MPRASTQNARPALRRLPTRPSRMVQAVVSRLLPLLFRSQGLELSHRDAAEALAEAFAAQQSGACNLLIAFRHPSTRDPVVMADLFWNGIPRAARRLKLQLGRALPVRPRLNQYRINRREAMQVFMQDLEQALVALMPDASRAMTTDAGEL